jgi:hypothetical protein
MQDRNTGIEAATPGLLANPQGVRGLDWETLGHKPAWRLLTYFVNPTGAGENIATKEGYFKAY